MASITLSGLGSGLDYQSWITSLVEVKQAKIDEVSKQASTVTKKQTAMSQMKTQYQNLQESISAFTTTLEKDNLFNQKSVKSSSDAVSADITAYANVQDLSVSVSQLATSTVAKSASVAAKAVEGSTLLSEISSGTVSEGSFSVYVNGKKNSIDIAKSDSLDDVLQKLNDIEGVSASLSDDGKLSIASTDSSAYSVTVGSSSDTSNFSNVMSLVRNTETGEYTSSKNIFATSTSSALTSTAFAAGNITEGTFTIGDREFTIDSTTTMDQLLKKINNSDAGATAYWDSNAGKLVVTSTDQGAINLNIEAGTSNFTDIMGLTQSEWNADDGSLISTKLTANSQTLGTNAVLSINGTTITSSSNTVTSDISGIKGLTLTLNKVTEDDKAANVNVTQDTSALVSAVESFVSTFNSVMSSTDTATDSKTGTLYGENLLNTLRNTLRRTVTASNGSTDAYNTLAKLGITTGKFSSDTSANTNELQFDQEKFLEAVNDDPDAVRNLLTGTNGIFTKMNTTIENALDTTKGYFATRDKSYSKEITNLNKKVSTMTTSLEKYQSDLEAKFQAMDEMIANFNKQASIFDSYFNTRQNSSSS